MDSFARLTTCDSATREALGRLPELTFPEGKTLFSAGSPCQGFVLLRQGSVRVSVTGENGRRLVLYRVAPGETCVQTTLCLMGGLDYTAEGVAETEVRLAIVPPPLFKRLLRDSGDFAEFVFERFGARLSEMTRLVESIAFLRVDARLASAVLSRAGNAAGFEATHQDLAEDIGAAREVVSRQLALFQRAGLVRLARGRIEIGDRAGLEDLSGA
ncbi:CRP/FNR family transcriptional regulator, anaerobic regulatory protein [Rhodoblastus acidophilus]|uniref:CRP/FNR family transcriptional regulator, anaerobic regulatory protein n=1 Tax=Rhodoblastus acidophilus TaxID=1074 RepID=A0A212R1H4_RHOAC|nr:Crp/Fnr family transcriptional regulator [Rhodoblastus acidophilus]RAI22279.1 Crp/Fnr family transcriptional regulator [Rhodoblastus acidophilus]SNB65796.1 CRP/FNR family transcriptional regulator, anaerobic regulatory protein [Rhodoblastus acidophilus]